MSSHLFVLLVTTGEAQGWLGETQGGDIRLRVPDINSHLGL